MGLYGSIFKVFFLGRSYLILIIFLKYVFLYSFVMNYWLCYYDFGDQCNFIWIIWDFLFFVVEVVSLLCYNLWCDLQSVDICYFLELLFVEVFGIEKSIYEVF